MPSWNDHSDGLSVARRKSITSTEFARVNFPEIPSDKTWTPRVPSVPRHESREVQQVRIDVITKGMFLEAFCNAGTKLLVSPRVGVRGRHVIVEVVTLERGKVRVKLPSGLEQVVWPSWLTTKSPLSALRKVDVATFQPKPPKNGDLYANSNQDRMQDGFFPARGRQVKFGIFESDDEQ